MIPTSFTRGIILTKDIETDTPWISPLLVGSQSYMALTHGGIRRILLAIEIRDECKTILLKVQGDILFLRPWEHRPPASYCQVLPSAPRGIKRSKYVFKVVVLYIK